jgi:hypothetical protein
MLIFPSSSSSSSAAVFFLLCWKSIRVLFMKMVDCELAITAAGIKGGIGGGGGDDDDAGNAEAGGIQGRECTKSYK